MRPQAPDKPLWQNRVPAGLKLTFAVVLIAFTASLPRRPHILYAFPACILLLLWIATRMPLGFAFRRILLAEFFIVGIAGLSLFAPGSGPLFASALLKSNICVFAIVLLGWTTPFHELISTLRRVGVPSIMVTTIALLYRYLPLLGEESRRMQRALASRTFHQTRRAQWRNLATIAGQLFVRSADRAERIYLAMTARGWK